MRAVRASRAKSTTTALRSRSRAHSLLRRSFRRERTSGVATFMCRHVCPDAESGVPHASGVHFASAALRNAHERCEHMLCRAPYCFVGEYHAGVAAAENELKQAWQSGDSEQSTRARAALFDTLMSEPSSPAARLPTLNAWSAAASAATTATTSAATTASEARHVGKRKRDNEQGVSRVQR